MKSYDHKKIEKKWAKKWEEIEASKAEDFSDKPKYYCLIEFPYPSGDGLHVGQSRPYTALDIVSRKRRAEGHNVLYPIGWDAFGLPTENYAIKTGVHPKVVTKKNTDRFREQLKSLGLSFDWSRETNTSDPDYYKWTQWIFLQLYKQGLAYKEKMPINWCLDCKIGLANEEVVNGACERCGGQVEQREKEQWMLAITKYAKKLLDGLKELESREDIKLQQTNWIGESHGADIPFKIETEDGKQNKELVVFTTRPDTLFGATYMVIAPEHTLVHEFEGKIKNIDEVRAYVEEARRKSNIERMSEEKEKTGVKLEGVFAVNPVNNEKIPVFVADYVMISYGTGAIMAVPAHDERDFAFAKKFSLPIIEVIKPQEKTKEGCWVGDGEMINSGQFTGKDNRQAMDEITKFAGGKKAIQYKLRDWIFSRQRYWGEPVPIIHCGKCGTVPVSEEDLPVELPDVKDYQPTDTGESPLANISDWVNVKCPACNEPAKRETDTMPNWAGSSWYFLRYADPNNDQVLADKKKLEYWMPVDWYNGGMEHTTLHLLYSRFWNQFLYDIKVVPTAEPYKKRTSHGMILGEGNIKMSKSRGNVVNPDEVVENYGADTLRLYVMFIGPFEQAAAWSTESLMGPRRFLEKVWRMQEKLTDEESDKHQAIVHKTIKKVGNDIETMDFNTAVSALMVLANELDKDDEVLRSDYKTLIRLLAPFAPFITEEIWETLQQKQSIHLEPWPKYNESKMKEEMTSIAIQVNGKVRATIHVSTDASEDEVKELALAQANIEKYISGKEIKKTIYVAGRILNLIA